MSASATNPFSFLFDRTDAINVAIFRICFGLIMAWEMLYFIRLDFVEIFLTGPHILFPYEPVSFLGPLPEPIMKLLVVVMLICCLLIAVGRWYRPAIVILAVGFTYIFVLDKAYYNNHLYLLCLLSGMLCLIPADKRLAWNNRYAAGDIYIPRWMLLMLQLQIVIVYFYGGIAKLNPDWLFESQPVRLLLASKAERVGLESLLTNELFVAFITFGGVVFDLFVGILFFIRRLRPYALAAAIFFNVTNAWIFDDINIFPYFMLCALILFVPAPWVKKQVEKIVKPRVAAKGKGKQAPTERFAWHRATAIALAVYFGLQVLLPFRHVLISGNVDWTGEAQRFSWRMKIQHRKMENLEFRIFDYDTRQQIPVDLKVIAAYKLNRDQIVQMTHDPKMVARFARFLEADHRRRTGAKGKVEVKADIQIGFNGRLPQRMVDPAIDLASAEVSLLRHNEWILPLEAE